MPLYLLQVKIIVIAIGKPSDSVIQALLDRYTRRISHYTKFGFHTFDLGKKNTVKQRKRFEKIIDHSDQIILLDENGESYDSIEFASLIRPNMSSMNQRLVFIIGGPYGLPSFLETKYPRKMSLSKMTLPHQMVRALLLEQIYRALTIAHNHPYHHV